MEKQETMYEAGKRYLSDALGKQIGNAITVAETAVDHFFPPSSSSSSSSSPSSSNNSSLPPPPPPSSSSPPSSPSSLPPASPPLPPPPSSPRDERMEAAPSSPRSRSSSPPPLSPQSLLRERHSHESSLGRVQKLGSKVQNRLHRKAYSRWNSVYQKSQDSLQNMEGTVLIVKLAQEHLLKQTENLKNTLSQMQLYIETKAVGLTQAIQLQANEALKEIAKVIQNIQKDIASTLKQVVEVISKGAASLPSYAQTKIKEFIMALPAKWAVINNSSKTLGQNDDQFLVHGHQMAQFADDSSQTLKSITDIFHQYIEKAQTLLESLKMASPPASPPGSPPGSPPSNMGSPSSDPEMDLASPSPPPQSPKSDDGMRD